MKKKWKALLLQVPLSVGLVLGGAQAVSAAGYVKLSKTGEEVLTECNPENLPYNTQCKVAHLPKPARYQLVAARSAPLIYNSVTVGTLYEKVWKHKSKPKRHVFGMRVVMNANQWDSSGAAFNVNDIFRQTLPNKRVAIAYYPDGATKALQLAGRTVHGLNEFDEPEPERNNTWVDFRVDVNAADPDGMSSASSPWLLTKTRAPAGFVLNTLGLRVLNSDVADIFDAVEIYTAGYQPDGVPPPEDDDDDDDDEDLEG